MPVLICPEIADFEPSTEAIISRERNVGCRQGPVKVGHHRYQQIRKYICNLQFAICNFMIAELASLMPASWIQIVPWLRQIDGLRAA
jgi:hypothetical protein